MEISPTSSIATTISSGHAEEVSRLGVAKAQAEPEIFV
jgi:hypothetical protein